MSGGGGSGVGGNRFGSRGSGGSKVGVDGITKLFGDCEEGYLLITPPLAPLPPVAAALPTDISPSNPI